MCEARAAVSVDTKSAVGRVNAVGFVKVVMVCSGCINNGNFAALLDYPVHTLLLQIDPTQIPLDFASDAAALDVGLELGAVETTIKPCVFAIFSGAF